tara:strand:- start:622 stop:1116 length:495 start_codon:yes stop_codon:yes gene_type:complete
MKKKYSLSKNEIITHEQGTIRDICASVLSNNRDVHLLDDLVQDISLILLSQMEETIQSLYETNQLRYFVARIVTNQVLSTSSPFHNTYRLREPKIDLNSDEYDSKADEVWLEAFKSSSETAKSIMYLKYDYGFKIREIATLKGISTRYVHKVLAKVLNELRNTL